MVLKDYVSLAPHQSGCYMYKNQFEQVIYVGKAKDIFNRVSSYFSSAQSTKTMLLLSEAVSIEYVTTDNELESLILEYNLIQQYNPKYNILLKDDKTYPYIVLTNEAHPRLLITREYKKVKGEYFGPYPNVTAAREVVDYLNRIYPLRKCRNMPNELCLYYHIKQCLGPCVYAVSKEEYKEYLSDITNVLKGNYSNMLAKLNDRMLEASSVLNFELALSFKEIIDYLETTSQKQRMNLKRDLNCDIVNYALADNKLSIQLLLVRNGNVIERQGQIFDVVDDHLSLVYQYLYQYYKINKIPDSIVVNDQLDREFLSKFIFVPILTPKIGDLKKLLEMSKENAQLQLEYQEKLIAKKIDKNTQITESILEVLDLQHVYRIDAFDISHIGGSYTVGAMVVFKDFKPSFHDYRKYKIVDDKNDDLKSMSEVVYRRYYRMLIDNEERPDLIVIDGGMNQYLVVKKIIDDLYLNIPVLSLKKDDKHQTSSMIYNDSEILFNGHIELKHLFVNIQNEVHRFAINYYRSLHSKTLSNSQLDNIDGIGAKSKTKLLQHFKTIEAIKLASLDDLKVVVNSKQAEAVLAYFKEVEDEKDSDN